MASQEDFKTHELPLARIKKIMRLEDDIAEAGAPRFMIAAEAPIVIAKACEIFVLEAREDDDNPDVDSSVVFSWGSRSAKAKICFRRM